MKTVTYTSHTPFAPCHLGIAVGPFEYVDLSEYRERDEDEKLGENAISIHAYCLPGRSQELKNSALFMPKVTNRDGS